MRLRQAIRMLLQWLDGSNQKIDSLVTWTSYSEKKPELGAFIIATAEIDGEMREPVIGIFESGVTDGGTGIVRLSDHPNDWAPVEYWIQLPPLPGQSVQTSASLTNTSAEGK